MALSMTKRNSILIPVRWIRRGIRRHMCSQRLNLQVYNGELTRRVAVRWSLLTLSICINPMPGRKIAQSGSQRRTSILLRLVKVIGASSMPKYGSRTNHISPIRKYNSGNGCKQRNFAIEISLSALRHQVRRALP